MGKAGIFVAWVVSVISVGMVGAVIVTRINNKALPGTMPAKILGKG